MERISSCISASVNASCKERRTGSSETSGLAFSVCILASFYTTHKFNVVDIFFILRCYSCIVFHGIDGAFYNHLVDRFDASIASAHARKKTTFHTSCRKCVRLVSHVENMHALVRQMFELFFFFTHGYLNVIAMKIR